MTFAGSIPGVTAEPSGTAATKAVKVGFAGCGCPADTTVPSQTAANIAPVAVSTTPDSSIRGGYILDFNRMFLPL
ncbi:MAG: hypothetical protein R3C19_21220 [Planctomycetaceae bacterium]